MVKNNKSGIPAGYLQNLLEQRTRNLLKTNEELSFLLESIPLIPYECAADRTMGITYIHKSVKKITGFSSKDFIADPGFWFRRIHPEDTERIRGEMKDLKDNEKLLLEYRWQIADGSYKWFTDHLQQIMNKQGKPAYILGYWLDITEQKNSISKKNTKYH